MISRLAKAAMAWEGLGFLISLVLGLGVLAFVVAEWVLHFVRDGRFFLAAATLVPSVLVGVFAIVRAPLALLLLFGSAAVTGVAFLSGAINVLLP